MINNRFETASAEVKWNPVIGYDYVDKTDSKYTIQSEPDGYNSGIFFPVTTAIHTPTQMIYTLLDL